ncbi:Protein translocase subunit SecE [uncultured archaeon]|nr:Protein translocase subunit SecE [uncultured archaeon]
MELNPIPAVRRFYADAQHIMSVSNKPSPDEFKRTLKVVLFGTLVMGLFGFIISLIVGIIVGSVKL